MERTISATGPVKAPVTVDVGSQLSGPISEMKADFNDRVKEGDLLAVIDRGPFEATRASAAANLAIAKADVALRQSMAAKARHQLVRYERDVGRYSLSGPSGSTSGMQLDHAESQSVTVKDDQAIAEAQLESSKRTVDQVRLATTKTSGVVTYTVIVEARNPDQKLYPDMTATARIVATRRDNVLDIPNEALRFHPPELAFGKKPVGPDHAVLWVRGSDGTLVPREVRLGLEGDRSTEILEGEITAGEAVVLRVQSGGRQGQP